MCHMRAATDWLVMCLAFVCVAVSVHLSRPLWINADGGFGPTVLGAQVPGAALAAVAIVVVVLVVCVVAGSTLVGPLRAMGAAGAGLGWGALGLDSMRSTLLAGAPGPAAVDGIVWTLIVLGLSWAIFGRGEGEPTVRADEHDERPDPLSSTEAVRAAAIGAIAAMLAAWLITQSDLRQQTVMAAVLGGFACGMAGRLAAPHVQPVLLPPAVILAGTLSGWLAWFVIPADLTVAVAEDGIPALLLPAPIDWAAGAIFGVPMGFAAAHGFHHEDGAASAAS